MRRIPDIKHSTKTTATGAQLLHCAVHALEGIYPFARSVGVTNARANYKCCRFSKRVSRS